MKKFWEIIKNIILVFLIALTITTLTLKEAFSNTTETIATFVLFGIYVALILLFLSDKGKTTTREKVTKVALISSIISTIFLIYGEKDNITVKLAIFIISILGYLISKGKKLDIEGKKIYNVIYNNFFLIVGIVSSCLVVVLPIIIVLGVFCFWFFVNFILTPFTYPITNGEGVSLLEIIEGLFKDIHGGIVWLHLMIIFLIVAIISFILNYFQKKRANNNKSKISDSKKTQKDIKT